MTPSSQHRLPVAVLLALSALLIAVAGCAAHTSSSAGTEGPGTVGATAGGVTSAASGEPSAHGCGTVPASTGPAVRIATVSVHAPERVPAGGHPLVLVQVSVTGTGPRVLADSVLTLQLVRDGQVLGEQRVTSGAGAVGVPLRPGSRYPSYTTQLAAHPCSPGTSGKSGNGTSASPAAATSPMPPGDYQLLAVLGYRIADSNMGADAGLGAVTAGADYQLVSAPVAIQLG